MNNMLSGVWGSVLFAIVQQCHNQLINYCVCFRNGLV